MALIGKLFHVQIIRHDWLTAKAEENWDREIPFAGLRGEITDRNGDVIVGSKLAPTLYFMPAQNKNIEEVAGQLTSVLDVPKEKLVEKMNQKTYLVKLAPEAKNISHEQAMEIQQMNISGIYTGVDYVRDYPYGDLLSRTLGFTGYDMQGLAGLEYQYEQYLKGKADIVRLFTDAKGTSLPHVEDGWKKGKQGSTVELTIDLNIQRVVERELKQATLQYEADQALAIAMDVKTGQILALASTPTFHPSNYSEVDQSIYNRNLPVWMTFEPGSTFKIITLSAALEEGKVDLHEDHFHDPGYSIVEDTRLRCWKREGHGHQSFLEVVENSCNPGFIELGKRVGEEKLSQYIRDFGFGQKTGSNIAGEAKGILFSPENYGPVEHATTSFGQGISVTPIQQVQAVAAAVNGGKLFRPYIVKAIKDSETGEIIEAFEPEMKRQVISEETSKQVREALESVVANGSGRNAFVDELRVGGKTGTAQKAENGRYKEGEYIVSFIGFAPADDPQIVVYVAVDNPKHAMQFGGVIAAPIVGNIMEDIQPILNIEPREGQIEKEYRWGDQLTYRVPDLTGKTKSEIAKLMYPFKLEWHGSGDRILTQLPKAGGLIRDTDTIHVYTDFMTDKQTEEGNPSSKEGETDPGNEDQAHDHSH